MQLPIEEYKQRSAALLRTASSWYFERVDGVDPLDQQPLMSWSRRSKWSRKSVEMTTDTSHFKVVRTNISQSYEQWSKIIGYQFKVNEWDWKWNSRWHRKRWTSCRSKRRDLVGVMICIDATWMQSGDKLLPTIASDISWLEQGTRTGPSSWLKGETPLRYNSTPHTPLFSKQRNLKLELGKRGERGVEKKR